MEVATGLPKTCREAGAAQAGPETSEMVRIAGVSKDDPALSGAASGAPLLTAAGGLPLMILTAE